MPYGPNEPTAKSLKDENTYGRALKDRVEEIGKKLLGGGALGKAAANLKSRSNVDAAVDSNGYGPTDVEYGGQPGQADRSQYNR